MSVGSNRSWACDVAPVVARWFLCAAPYVLKGAECGCRMHVWLFHRIDESEYEDPEKISQSPLTYEGFAPSLSFFMVRPISCASIAVPLAFSCK